MEIIYFDTHQIRAKRVDGILWYLLEDINAALGRKNSFSFVEGGEKISLPVPGLSRPRTFVAASALRTMAIRGSNLKGLPFREWLLSEYLPSLKSVPVVTAPPAEDVEDVEVPSIEEDPVLPIFVPEVLPFDSVVTSGFVFDGHPVRMVNRYGLPWFVAKDVCEALGYAWNGTQRVEHVPDEWRGVMPVVTPSGEQDMVVLSEQGLYFFLVRSDKPKAIPFQKWVSGSVLPSINRTGSYESDIHALFIPSLPACIQPTDSPADESQMDPVVSRLQMDEIRQEIAAEIEVQEGRNHRRIHQIEQDLAMVQARLEIAVNAMRMLIRNATDAEAILTHF
ncbi:MAG: hypothetical protein HQL99_15395 [Magnetococcales bacterium]|nr:hypothetical protein [Magnetococcales bacterium]